MTEVSSSTGPTARPCNIAWIRSLVRQGLGGGVATSVQQIGSKPYTNLSIESVLDDRYSGMCVDVKDGKKVILGYCIPITHPTGGDPAEWPADLRVREFPGGLR